MSVRIGSTVPGMKVNAYVRGASSPHRLALTDFRGKWLVIVFYPRDFTFVCPTELHALAELHAQFEAADAAVVAASTDSYYSHRAWFETDPRLQAVSFPVIADTSHDLADAFGVLQCDGTALRGTFIIDPWGDVRHILVNDADVGRSIDETLRTLRALQTGVLCPVSWTSGQELLSDRVAEAA